MRGLVVIVLVGCAGASAQSAQPAPSAQPLVAPVPAVVGLETPLAFAEEAMSYAIRFRGFQVARVQVAVGKPGWFEGRPAIIVKARGATDGVVALIGDIEWELATTIDL